MLYLLEGFKLLYQPGLKRFVIIPLVINILLFCVLFLVARHYFNELNLWITHHLPSWLSWLSLIFWLLFIIGFLSITVYIFVTLANLLSAPFNSLLSEKVELHLTGNTLEKTTWLTFCKDTPRIIKRQMALISYYLPRAIVLLILFFIPIIQIVAGLLWFLFNAWYMTIQYIDIPTDNHQIPLKDVHHWLNQRKIISLSFGMSILIASMIPIINFFVIPAAVAGATKFYLDQKTNGFIKNKKL